jgi:hypothetical protein
MGGKTALKEIGILELHYHSIFFYTMARICKTKNTRVTLFTTKKIFSAVEKYLNERDDYTIILKEENESINSFLKKVEQIGNEKLDLLFINTIQETCKDLPHYFRFKPKCRMALTIHNVNSWLNQKLKINIKKPFRTVDTVFSSLLINKVILPKFNELNVVYSPIKEYIVKNTHCPQKIYTLPFTFFDESELLKDKKNAVPIRFVVPGAIEQSRRNYEIVADVFHTLFNQFGDNISLCLLGKPVGTYGKQMINTFKQMKKQGYNISLFEAFVPEATYSNILTESDIILSPIKLKTKGLGEIEETYGLTKGTASPFEAIQYAKPLIVPRAFTVLQELHSSTLQYANKDDLENTIADLISNRKKIEDLKQKAHSNSQKFSLPMLQDYFENNILKTN